MGRIGPSAWRGEDKGFYEERFSKNISIKHSSIFQNKHNPRKSFLGKEDR